MSAPADTTDLVATLQRIHAKAKRTREGLSNGTIPKGTAALGAIENEAHDALERADQPREHTPAARAR